MHPIGKAGRVVLPLVAVALLVSAPARALITELPSSLAHDVLSETVPTAFDAFDLPASSYVFEWPGGKAPEGVSLSLLEGTVQWVRVADVLVLPRVRLKVRIAGGDEGRVSNSGFSQTLVAKGEGPVRVLEAEM